MNDSLRTFIAIELDQPTHEALRRVQDAFKHLDVNVKWVNPENIHITLRFLGNLSPKKAKIIINEFPRWFDGLNAFETKIDHLGAFPKTERPRVIWLGLHKNADMISNVAAVVENQLCRLGFPKEREKFIPHLTIGRVRSNHNIHLLSNKIKGLTFSPIPQKITTVTFFQSTLTSQGPIYEKLASCKLS